MAPSDLPKSGGLPPPLAHACELYISLSVLFSIPSDSRIATTRQAPTKPKAILHTIESVKLSIRQQQNCSEKDAYVKLYFESVHNCDTKSKDFSEETFSEETFLTWTKKTLGNCQHKLFDLNKDVINFDLVNFNSTNNSDICPQVLTIKFKNGSGSTVYSNSHELNNRLNPDNCRDLAEAKKLKGKCLKL